MGIKSKSKFYNIVLLLALFICVISSAVGFTGAWYSNYASSTTALQIGKSVQIRLYNASSGGSTTSVIGNKQAVPGDFVTFDAVYLRATQNYSTCFVRAKLELENNSSNLFNLTSAEIVGNGTYSWVKNQVDGFFYLVSGSYLESDDSNLLPVVYGAGNSYRMLVQKVKVVDSATNDNGDDSESCTVKVTVQAIQTANYAHANWAQVESWS